MRVLYVKDEILAFKRNGDAVSRLRKGIDPEVLPPWPDTEGFELETEVLPPWPDTEGSDICGTDPNFEDVDDKTPIVSRCRHGPEGRITGPKMWFVC